MTSFKNDNLPLQLFRDIPLFVEVAKLGSFTKAAEKLDVSLPTFSRRIAGMEKLMGFQLFCRKGPKIALTEYGQRFFESCQGMIQQVEETLEDISEDSMESRGIVRVLIHSHVYQMYMSGAVESFARKWTGIELDIQMTGMMNDLLEKTYDLAITAGAIPDAGFKIRKLLSVTPRLYASPDLIEAFGLPAAPEDLKLLPCICLSQLGSTWHLRRNAEERRIDICRRHVTDSPLIARELALAGAGIAMLAPVIAKEDEKTGALQSVLTAWTVPDVVIYTVRPPVQPPKRVRLFMEHLVKHLSAQLASSVR